LHLSIGFVEASGRGEMRIEGRGEMRIVNGFVEVRGRIVSHAIVVRENI
jgi:hypothetical protein